MSNEHTVKSYEEELQNPNHVPSRTDGFICFCGKKYITIKPAEKHVKTCDIYQKYLDGSDREEEEISKQKLASAQRAKSPSLGTNLREAQRGMGFSLSGRVRKPTVRTNMGTLGGDGGGLYSIEKSEAKKEAGRLSKRKKGKNSVKSSNFDRKKGDEASHLVRGG